jgi:hypothetical protein
MKRIAWLLMTILCAAIFLFAGDKKNSPFITGWVCNTLTGSTGGAQFVQVLLKSNGRTRPESCKSKSGPIRPEERNSQCRKHHC